MTHIILESFLDLESDEIEDAITDGSQDRGVDAVVITGGEGKKTVHILQVKCTPKFEKAKNNFPSNEVDKLLSFITDLLETGDKEMFKRSCNHLLSDKVEQIFDLLEQEVPSFVIHLAGNMEPLSENQEERFSNSLARYKSFKLKQHTLESISAQIIEKTRPEINGTIQLIDKQYFERGDGNIRGLIATIPATEIIQLVKDPDDPEQVLPDIFDGNVRVYLTEKNRINKAIIDSALSPHNNEFWYLNNGITMTCNRFDYTPKRSPIVTMEDIQIVNGCQTANALFQAHKRDPEKLEDVLLLVRIYQTTHREISLRIAESTNSQTPIRSRDLRSNDEVQKKLEDSFRSLGYFYERKKNQYRNEDKSYRIDAQKAGRVFLAYELGDPQTAYAFSGKVFGKKYDKIFNEETTANKLLIPLEVVQEIETKKKNLQKDIRKGVKIERAKQYLIHGVYHILYAVGLLCKLQSLNQWDSTVARSQIDDAQGIVYDVVASELKVNRSISLNNFFKGTKTKSKIEKKVRDYINTP